MNRQDLPPLDDWVDGRPDAWDYEAVLRENEVTVEWCDQLTSDGITFTPAPSDLCGWGLCWKHGYIYIGQTTEIIARKAAAMFVSLWLRNVSATFADKLMDGFIVYLERQENPPLAFLAKIEKVWYGRVFHLTNERFGVNVPFTGHFQEVIIDALDPRSDEEIIVTFTKRKKQ